MTEQGGGKPLSDHSGGSINATTRTADPVATRVWNSDRTVTHREIPCDNDFEGFASHRRYVDPSSHGEIGPPPAQAKTHRRRPPVQTHSSREQTQFSRDVSASSAQALRFWSVRIRFLRRNSSGGRRSNVKQLLACRTAGPHSLPAVVCDATSPISANFWRLSHEAKLTCLAKIAR